MKCRLCSKIKTNEKQQKVHTHTRAFPGMKAVIHQCILKDCSSFRGEIKEYNRGELKHLNEQLVVFFLLLSTT